jgi:hypothetical protein
MIEQCKKEGNIMYLEEVDIDKIQSMIHIAKNDLLAADFLCKKKISWSSTFKLYYDVIHELVDAYARLKKVKTKNHQCLYVYICDVDEELNFAFFEKLRTKRNGINYYGEHFDEADFKELKLEIDLTIKYLFQQLSF